RSERLAVVRQHLSAYVAAGRQYVAVRTDLRQRGAFGKARDVRVRACVLLATPRVVGTGDPRDVLVGQLAMCPVHHAAHLPCVDEEHLTMPVAEPAVLLVARQEPQTGWNLRRVEELSGQPHHAV